MRKIGVDAMGGDFAPDIVVEGAALVRKEMNHGIILVGDEEKIRLSAEGKKDEYGRTIGTTKISSW